MPHISIDQLHVSSDGPAISCSVSFGTEKAAVLFLEAADVYPPLQLDLLRAKLLRLAEALAEAARLPQGISADHLVSPES
jgi:hypothetical protein